MQWLKRTPIERIIRRLERNPGVVVTFATLSMRMSKDYMRVRAGEIDGSEFRRRGFTHVGSISGGMAGAAAGALAGTAVAPGLGTVLGAFAGSMVGDDMGTRLGRAAVEHAEIRLSRRDAAEAGADAEESTAAELAPLKDERPRRQL